MHHDLSAEADIFSLTTTAGQTILIETSKCSVEHSVAREKWEQAMGRECMEVSEDKKK